jgi:hypothetical protein
VEQVEYVGIDLVKKHFWDNSMLTAEKMALQDLLYQFTWPRQPDMDDVLKLYMQIPTHILCVAYVWGFCDEEIRRDIRQFIVDGGYPINR